MDRVQTYVADQQILAAELNSIQDNAMGVGVGTLGSAFPGMDATHKRIIWQLVSGSATAQLRQIDDSIDWRDRVISAKFYGVGGASELPGGALDAGFQGSWMADVFGYTGLGGYSAVGPNVVVSNGAPPILSDGASWAIETISNLWLYVEPADGVLKLYNATGSTTYPFFIIEATGQTGYR